MKYIAIIVVLFIIFCVIVNFAPDTKSKNFIAAVAKQPTYFAVPNNKANAVWDNASVYLIKMKHLIYGRPTQQNDTMILIPYIPGLSYHRGNFIQVRKKVNKDSTTFFTEWFYYDMPDTLAAKEMAYYMQYGIGRYDK
jgi:hypothetical protein